MLRYLWVLLSGPHKERRLGGNTNGHTHKSWAYGHPKVEKLHLDIIIQKQQCQCGLVKTCATDYRHWSRLKRLKNVCGVLGGRMCVVCWEEFWTKQQNCLVEKNTFKYIRTFFLLKKDKTKKRFKFPYCFEFTCCGAPPPLLALFQWKESKTNHLQINGRISVDMQKCRLYNT